MFIGRLVIQWNFCSGENSYNKFDIDKEDAGLDTYGLTYTIRPLDPYY